MTHPIGAAASAMARQSQVPYLSPSEADLFEHLHPVEDVITWKGAEKRRVAMVRRRLSAANGSRPLYSLFVKSERAPVHIGQRYVYWNSMDPTTGEFRLQQSKSKQFGDAENGLLRQCLRYCNARTDAVVLLGVYDGDCGGRRVYRLFSVRLLREEGDLFVGEVIRPIARVPWVGAWRPARQRASDLRAAASTPLASPDHPPTPSSGS